MPVTNLLFGKEATLSLPIRQEACKRAAPAMRMAGVSPSGESIVMSTISSILLWCACTDSQA